MNDEKKAWVVINIALLSLSEIKKLKDKPDSETVLAAIGPVAPLTALSELSTIFLDVCEANNIDYYLAIFNGLASHYVKCAWRETFFYFPNSQKKLIPSVEYLTEIILCNAQRIAGEIDDEHVYLMSN